MTGLKFQGSRRLYRSRKSSIRLARRKIGTDEHAAQNTAEVNELLHGSTLHLSRWMLLSSLAAVLHWSQCVCARMASRLLCARLRGQAESIILLVCVPPHIIPILSHSAWRRCYSGAVMTQWWGGQQMSWSNSSVEVIIQVINRLMTHSCCVNRNPSVSSSL